VWANVGVVTTRASSTALTRALRPRRGRPRRRGRAGGRGDRRPRACQPRDIGPTDFHRGITSRPQRAEAAQSQAARITVQVDNASIEDVRRGLAAAFSGRTIILGRTSKATSPPRSRNQPWDLAMYAVLESQGLAVKTLPGGILNVVSQIQLARADSTVPITTRLVRVN